MTFVRFVNFLHECGLDIIALGFLNSVLSALAGKLLEKYGKQLPAKTLAGVPFVLGILLYAIWFSVFVRDFSSPGESAALIAQRGFGTGLTAVAIRSLKDLFPKTSAAGTEENAPAPAGETDLVAALRRAVFRQLLSDCLEEPQLSEAAAELAAPAETAENSFEETSEILAHYLPQTPEAEFSAFAKLADAVRRYPQL